MPNYSLYVKKHCFRDRSEYLKPRVGKTNLTDYVAREHGISFSDNIIPATTPVRRDQLEKIVVGWNIGFDKEIQRLVPELERRRDESVKNIDILCRASVRSDWTLPLRSNLQSQLESLANEFRVQAPTYIVSRKEYYREMLSSRICVSPFGYGEICWRDFEAILSGCVLVKPDMSHVETYPDIFVPEVTYVPVEWGYSNLASVVRRLMADPSQCEPLRANALAALKSAFGSEETVERIRTVLAPALWPTVLDSTGSDQ